MTQFCSATFSSDVENVYACIGLLGEGKGWEAGSLRACLYWILFLLLGFSYDQSFTYIFFTMSGQSKNPVSTGSQREIGIFLKDISLKVSSP